MNPRFGKRSWVKLWVNEWLDGTTRFEMTDSQRAFWIDLLALAGRSRFPGLICAGKVRDAYIGYPINKFQALMAEALDIDKTFALFESTGKIKVTVTSESPVKLVMIELVNWERYQSEYQRQKKYRKQGLQRSDSQSDKASNKTEGETEGEVEGEEKQRQTAAAFAAIGFDKPFGSLKFQKVWVKHYTEGLQKHEWVTQIMEATIQNCQRVAMGIPPQFYEAKRDVEARENASIQKKAPL